MGRKAEVVKLRSNARTHEEWAGIIKEKWQDNVKSIFETALMLETAHAELGPPMFQKMVREDLKWSKMTASRLLAIARDDKLAGVTHALLPSSWATLHELTK